MKKLSVLMLFACVLPFAASAQNDDFGLYMNERARAFDDYLNKSVADHNKMLADWEGYRAVAEEEYMSYREKEKASYEEYRNRILKCWGEDNYAEDGAKRFVDYSEDLQSRADVDLENGIVEVEILSEFGESIKEKTAKLKKAVKDFVELKLDTDSLPAFLDQMDLERWGLSEDSEIDEIADGIVDKSAQDSIMIDTPEGQKQLVKIRIELAEDHLSARAAQYRDIVRSNSIRFSIDEPLIFAVIEQESAFNYRAKSSAPAYGLMQLVPRYGGREAFMHVHGKDFIPLPVYLYVPKNNVELGTGYLHKLMTVTFADVEDGESRMLCAIAAYNTGPNNVARAMTGDTSVSKAVSVINAMSYDQLYDHLVKNLPYAETRSYIQAVTAKRLKYIR